MSPYGLPGAFVQNAPERSGIPTRRAAKPRPRPKPKRKRKPGVQRRETQLRDAAATFRQVDRVRQEREVFRQVGQTARRGAKGTEAGVSRAARSARAIRQDPALARIFAAADRAEARRRAGAQPQVQAAGVQPGPFGLPASGGEGFWGGVTGLVENVGREGLGILLGVPNAAQLGAEASFYPLLKALGKEEKAEADLKAAGSAIASDYSYRWGPLFEGKFGTFAERAYEAPLSTALDVGGAYAAVGRAPSIAAKATARLAPAGSQLAARAQRFGSIRAPGEILLDPTGRYPIQSQGGRRYRPPKEVTGRPARGAEEARTISIPRRPAGPNIITQAVQRRAGRAAERVAGRIERAVEGRMPPGGRPRTTGERAAQFLGTQRAVPLTQQQKFERAGRAQTREIVDVRTQREAALGAKLVRDFERSRRKVKGDIEETALRLHMEGVLSPRAGLTPRQLRDQAANEIDKNITAAKARGEKVELSARNLEQIRAVPDELLTLTDISIPAVARVQRALRRAGKLSARTQPMAVRAGLTSAQAARARPSLASGALLAGQRWAPEVLREMRKAGATRAEIAAVRAGAIRPSPRLDQARTKLQEAQARYRQAASKVDRTQARVQVKAARERYNTELEVARARHRTQATKARANVAAQRRTYEHRLGMRQRLGRAESTRRLGAARAARAKEPSAPTVAQTLRPTRSKEPTLPTLRDRERVARTAEQALVKARIAAATQRAAPVSLAEAKGLRANLTAAEKHLERVRGRRGADSAEAKTARRDLQTAERAYAALRHKTAGTAARIGAARARVRELGKEVRRLEERALGLTAPTRPELVRPGIYVPHRPVDEMSLGPPPSAKKASLTGPAKALQSHATLIRKGNIDLNPALLTETARRAVSATVGVRSISALAEVLNLGAFHAANGKWSTGRRALQLAKGDPNRVVLVNAGAVSKLFRKLDELEEGKWLDEAGQVELVKDAIRGEGRGYGPLPDEATANQYVAISKAVADEWRNATFKIPLADKALDLWKGGILAFAPRWYVNNLVGLSFQYGLLSMGDLRSIIRANRSSDIKAAIPDEIAMNTFAAEVGWRGGVDAGRLRKAMEVGFRINNRMESFWRRGAYLSEATKALRREGVRTRKLSEVEIARAIENMPPSMALQIGREVERFMGDFRKFNRFEREVVKRVLPFYSWLRVMGRLTVSLPFRNPVRAELLNVLTKAGTAGINPDDYMRPIWDRSAIVLPGGLRLRTMGASAPATLAPFLQHATSPQELLTEIGASSNPLFQGIVAQTTGRQFFGGEAFAPPGVPGPALFGRDPQRINRITGLPETVTARPSILDTLINVTPFAGLAGTARRGLAAGETTFDTASVYDLLANRLGADLPFAETRPEMLFYNRRNPRVLEPAGPAGVWSGLGGFTGFPISREAPGALTRDFRRRAREHKQAERETRRRQRREKARG